MDDELDNHSKYFDQNVEKYYSNKCLSISK